MQLQQHDAIKTFKTMTPAVKARTRTNKMTSLQLVWVMVFTDHIVISVPSTCVDGAAVRSRMWTSLLLTALQAVSKGFCACLNLRVINNSRQSSSVLFISQFFSANRVTSLACHVPLEGLCPPAMFVSAKRVSKIRRVILTQFVISTC